MSDWLWARGQLSWRDRDDAGPTRETDVGRVAEINLASELSSRGWKAQAAAGKGDLVVQPAGGEPFHIEVKPARPARKGRQVFVTTPKEGVDAYVFVGAGEQPMYWVAPRSKVVGTHGVLQESDVAPFTGDWTILSDAAKS